MLGWLRRHLFAVTYLVLLVATDAVVGALPPARQERLAAWASTSVTNLEHHPVGALVASAFLGTDHQVAWPVLAALGLFGADRLLGPARSAVLCALAHVLGTLVSEGIVAYRVHAGGLPRTALSQVDIGPSYVVVAALTVAVLAGSWPRRVAPAAGLVALWPYLFAGLTRLDVAALGHTVSVTLGTLAAGLLWLRARRTRAASEADGGAPVHA